MNTHTIETRPIQWLDDALNAGISLCFLAVLIFIFGSAMLPG